MNAHDGRSSGESPSGRASAVLAASCDSPVSTDSSHSSSCAASRRRSAGTTSPTRRCTTSPGTISVTFDLDRLPVALDEREVPDLGVQRLDRLLRPVLVEEAQSDAHRHDPADDQRLRAIAHDGRDDGREQEQAEEIAAHLADEDREGADTTGAQDVRPVQGKTPTRLFAGQSRLDGAETGQNVSRRHFRGRRQIELLRLAWRGVPTARADHATQTAVRIAHRSFIERG